MAEQEIFNNLDMNGKIIKKARLEYLSSDPSGGDLWDWRVWFNTSVGKLKYYNGTTVITVATGNNDPRKYQGHWDASSGAFPTAGSGTGGAVAAGDMWFVSADGTVDSHAYTKGDTIVANADGADAAAEFDVNEGDRVDLTPFLRRENKHNQNFTADTEKTLTATTLDTIEEVEVWRDVNGDGTRYEKITSGVQVHVDGSDSTIAYVTVGVALTGARVKLVGTRASNTGTPE